MSDQAQTQTWDDSRIHHELGITSDVMLDYASSFRLDLDAVLKFTKNMRDDLCAEIDSLRAQLAEAGEYEPLKYPTFIEDQMNNDTYIMVTVDGSHLEVGRDVKRKGIPVVLPSYMRLCQRKERGRDGEA